MADLTFGKKRRRVNYDLLRAILVWTVQIAIVCFLAFALVWYFGQRVSVIGDSMNPELSNGDVTLMNKVVYNMSNPKRGDVIAFMPNGDESSHYYIKRIVGLPGETIEVQDEKIVLGDDEYFVLGDDSQNSEDSRLEEIGKVRRSDIVGKVWFVISGENFGFVR